MLKSSMYIMRVLAVCNMQLFNPHILRIGDIYRVVQS